MIGLKQAAGLVASAILFVSSFLVPAGPPGTVAVDQVDGQITEATADGPAPIGVQGLTVYDPVVSEGSSLAPVTYEGQVDRVQAIAATTHPAPRLSFGDERLEVPQGSTITIEHITGTVDLSEADRGAQLSITGTATDVTVEPPENAAASTPSNEGVPVSTIRVDGRTPGSGFEETGAFDSIEFQVAPPEDDARLEIGAGPFPLTVDQSVEVLDYVGAVVYASADAGVGRLHLDGYGEVRVGDTTIRQSAEAGLDPKPDTDTDVTEPPKADFSYDPVEPPSAEPVSFEDETEAGLAIVDRQWDFGDGATSRASNPDHAFPAPGTYEVTLSVTDANGRSDEHAETVTVVNTPPEIDVTWTPLTPDEQETVNFTANVQDRDDNLETVEWSFSDGTTVTGTHVEHSFPAKGSYDVTAVARDAEGAEGIAQATVHVENAPPEAGFEVDPVPPVATQPAQLVSNSTSPGSGQLVNWTWQVNGLEDPLYGPQVDLEFPSSGDVRVSLTVEDSHGDTDRVDETVTVQAPPPDVEIQLDPVYPNPGRTVAFQAHVEMKGQPAAAEWTFSDGATAEGLTAEHAFQTPGPASATIVVTDSNGNKGLAERTFLVNHPPEATLTLAGEDGDVNETAVLTDDAVTFEAQALDADGNETTLAWYDATTPAEDSANCSVEDGGGVMTCAWPDDDTTFVQVIAEDPNQAADGDRIDVIVLNRKPTLDPQVPSVVEAGEPAEIPANPDDPDGTVEQVRWLLDGAEIDTGDALDHVFEEAGTYEVQINATDDDGAVTTTNVTVEVNEPPTVSADAEPRNTVTGEPVSFSTQASDPDGDDADLSYDWAFGDGATSTGDSPTYAYQEPGTYQATVTVTDEDGAVNDASVTVDVDTPELDAAIEATPATPTAGDNVTLEVVYEGSRTVDEVRWEIGDTTRVTQDATTAITLEDPRHYHVSARISTEDGASDQAQRTLRVTGASAHEIVLNPRLPDGRCPALASPVVEVRFTNLETEDTVGIQEGQLDWTIAQGACRLSSSYPAGTWSRGDGYRLVGTVDGNVTSTRGTFELDGDLQREFVLQNTGILLEKLLVAERSQEPLLLEGSDSNTTYHSPFEPVTVRGLVTWGEGTPVDTWDVQFEVSYDGPDHLLGSQSLTYRSWTEATSEEGIFETVAPAPILGADPGDTAETDPESSSFVYLPGRYTVDVVAASELKADSDRVTFVQDPEGIFAALEDV